MHAFFVETVPASAECFFCKPFSIERAIIADYVVLARDVKYFARLNALEILVERVEFFRLGKMAQVAGVQNEVRRAR